MQELLVIQWLESTTKALNRLPWQETNLPDGRIPPRQRSKGYASWWTCTAKG